MFYSAELQFNTSLLIYVGKFFNTTVYGFHIPVNVITAFEPFFVVTFTPVITYLLVSKGCLSEKLKSRGVKLSMAFLLCGVGFYVLAVPFLGGYQNLVSIGWLLLPAAIIGVSDVLVLPSALSFLGDNISKHTHNVYK